MHSHLQQIEKWTELARQADWSVAALAKKCGVSMRTLERFFLKKMGRRPLAWLREQRQCRAIELLRDGCKVKEAATVLGYKHATHFSREFKKYWGRSPSKNHRHLAEDTFSIEE